MRRFSAVLGLTAALIAAAATPAAAHTISPPSHDFGTVKPGATSDPIIFTITAQGSSLTPGPTVLSGDRDVFSITLGFPGACNGFTTLSPGQSCSFASQFGPISSGAEAATLGIPEAAAAVTGTGSGSSKKKCKKGKKSAVAAKKKKKCKKGKK